MTLPSVTLDGKCSNCGGESFTHVEDRSVYTTPVWDAEAKKWRTTSYVNDVQAESDEAMRFFCDACGTYHAVPDIS